MTKEKYAFLFLLLVMVILMLIYTEWSKNLMGMFTSSERSEVKYTFRLEDEDYYMMDANETSDSALDCNPIRKAAQYYVDIDGVLYPQVVPLSMNKSIDFDCLNRNRKIKRILAWNTFFGHDYYFGFGRVKPFQANRCPVVNCEFTTDRNLLLNSDYVIVHMRDAIDPIPKFRPPDQKWLFLLYESPIHTDDFSQMNNVFNISSTYKIESDFPINLDVLSWEPNAQFDENNIDYFKDKSESVAAVISNCGASSQRMQYIHELSKHIRVDLFGACGKPCPTQFKNSQPGDCKDIIGKEYKFFLSFENSVCKNYITEKFFLELKHYIVPVTLGAGPYDSYVPKSAYINAFDFETPKELAKYLNYLSSNNTAYHSFFKWKKHVRYLEPNGFIPFCDMCIKLQLEEKLGVENRILSDLDQYWGKKANCKKVINENPEKFILTDYT